MGLIYDDRLKLLDRQVGQPFSINRDAETGCVGQFHSGSLYIHVTAKRLLAETQEAGHFAARLGVLHSNMQVHLGGRK